MNQKEYLEEKRKEMEAAEKTYKQGLADFTKKFNKEILAAEDHELKRQKAEAKMENREREIESVLYGSRGWYHRDIQPAVQKVLDKFGDDHGTYYDPVGDVFKAVKSKDPILQRLGTELEKVGYFEYTDEYHEAHKQVEEAKNDYEWLRQHVNRMSDLSTFRQWCKEKKERDATDARLARHKETLERAKEAVLAYYEKHKPRSKNG